eukprot:EG_transcript_11103
MQSTSPPGRIQVTDLFCHAILAVPGQPFTFDDSHEVMCKGFGMVKSHFVKNTTETLPKELQTSLGLKPNLGLYYFDNLVPGPRRSAALADGRPDASPGDAALPVHPLPSGALDGGPRRMQSTARLLR